MHTNDWNPPDWYRFVGDEAALLDARGFVAWVNLFTADGRYWMPTHEQALENEPALALFDETPEVLLLRAERLLHPMTHVQTPPSRTHHHVSAVRLQDSSDHQVVVSSMQWIVEQRAGVQRPSPTIGSAKACRARARAAMWPGVAATPTICACPVCCTRLFCAAPGPMPVGLRPT